MIVLQLLRLALIGLVLAAFLLRHSKPELFLFLRLNLAWLILGYIVLTLATRYLESRRKDTGFGRLLGRLFPGLARTWACEKCGVRNRPGNVECESCGAARRMPAWVCEVCENENAGDELRCSKCTVPRPGFST